MYGELLAYEYLLISLPYWESIMKFMAEKFSRVVMLIYFTGGHDASKGGRQ
jgi:hypothetical protein